MPVERSAICPECHEPCDTAVKHGLVVRHYACHIRFLRRQWTQANEDGKRAIEQIASSVTQCQMEWEAEHGKRKMVEV